MTETYSSNLILDSEKLYYHGTRAYPFSSFDINMLGSGEGAYAAIGFYFASSLKGACNHARFKAKQSGKPLVYVCKVKREANILTLDKPIKEHSKAVQELWNGLPVWLSTKTSKDWYYQLAMSPEWSANSNFPQLTEKERCSLLNKFGFDVIRRFENGAFVDHYLHGSSHFVMNPNVLDIVEVIDVDAVHDEICGNPKNYSLANEPALLGSTKIMSRLRIYP